MIINQINNTNDYIIKIIKNNIDIYNHNVLEKITNKIINKIKKQNKLEKLIILEFYPIKKYGTLIILKNIKTILKTENEIEVKIIIHTDYPILYKIDYNIIKECNIDYKNIYYYKNNFYLQIKNTISEKDYLYIIDSHKILCFGKLEENTLYSREHSKIYLEDSFVNEDILLSIF